MLPNTLEDIARQLVGLQKSTERLLHQRSGANRLIDSAVLTAPVATVTFANIPNIYDHLLILYYARSALAAINDNLAMRFNADAGNNYDWFVASISTGGVAPFSALATNLMLIGALEGATAPANTFSTGSARINNYANNVNHKSYIADCSLKTANAAANLFRVVLGGHWRNTAPITSITLFNFSTANLVAGSRFDLYGIQGGA